MAVVEARLHLSPWGDVPDKAHLETKIMETNYRAAGKLSHNRNVCTICWCKLYSVTAQSSHTASASPSLLMDLHLHSYSLQEHTFLCGTAFFWIYGLNTQIMCFSNSFWVLWQGWGPRGKNTVLSVSQTFKSPQRRRTKMETNFRHLSQCILIIKKSLTESLLLHRCWDERKQNVFGPDEMKMIKSWPRGSIWSTKTLDSGSGESKALSERPNVSRRSPLSSLHWYRIF